jgi:hypothetical protein
LTLRAEHRFLLGQVGLIRLGLLLLEEGFLVGFLCVGSLIAGLNAFVNGGANSSRTDDN